MATGRERAESKKSKLSRVGLLSLLVVRVESVVSMRDLVCRVPNKQIANNDVASCEQLVFMLTITFL